jgi:hypothetical protein
MSFVKSSNLEFLNIILVSSANRIGLDILLMVFDRSFMQRKKSKGPKIDPCGIYKVKQKTGFHLAQSFSSVYY